MWSCLVSGLAAFALAAAGCGGPAKVKIEDSESGALTGGVDGLIPDEPTTTTGQVSGACLTETTGAEQRKVALYMMLDSSGSMEEQTGTIRTKWDSVQRALRGFLAETRNSDLLLGMQFFPLLKPGTKFVCEDHDDCGVDGGLCFKSTCRMGTTIQVCRTNADCPGGPTVNPCVDFGLCSGSDPNAPLACLLDSQGSCGTGMGRCEDFKHTCTDATTCDPRRYGTPAVEIQPIATGLAAVDQALMGKLPEGLTPTVPALQGSIDHARQWAIDHPDQTVAVLLATDGLPTECGVQQQTGGTETINQVLGIAADGVAADVPIRTFVIGVFQPGADASINNTNAIAQAGGTDKALFIDAGGEVEEGFLNALREIRSERLACNFKIPDSDKMLDYFSVNLEFDNGTSKRQLGYVRDSGGCSGSADSWYYDTDPNQRKPTSIQICPGICQEVRSAANGSISLQLGCRTIVR